MAYKDDLQVLEVLLNDIAHRNLVLSNMTKEQNITNVMNILETLASKKIIIGECYDYFNKIRNNIIQLYDIKVITEELKMVVDRGIDINKIVERFQKHDITFGKYLTLE